MKKVDEPAGAAAGRVRRGVVRWALTGFGLGVVSGTAYPEKGLIAEADGNFYGTTYQSGDSAGGTILQMTPAGVLNNRYHFICVKGEALGPICRLTRTPE